MASINILMATYNGERYIDKQILSIIAQTYKDWILFIHDDGSVDRTVEIINHFCKLEPRIRLIEDCFSVRNAGKHFLHMLRFTTAPYICFCDQDDIWLENKLERMISVIESKDNSIPQVVFSDAYLYHDMSNCIGGKLLFTRPHCLQEILFTNGGIHGSASIFNTEMKKHLSRPFRFVSMHDHLLTLVGCTFGGITFLDEKLFLYRQHATNVTGNMETNLFRRIMKGFSFSNKQFTLSRTTLDAIVAFSETCEDELSSEDRSVIYQFLSFEGMNPVKRFFSIVRDGYTLGNSQLHLWIKILTRAYIG